MDDEHETDGRLNFIERVRSVSLRRSGMPLVLLTVLLAVLLRGTLPKTYSEMSFSNLETQFFLHGTGESSPWDWRGNWTKIDAGVSSVLSFEKDVLNLEAVFSEGATQVAKIRKSVGLAIVDFPVFSIRAWVSTSALWHVRLICEAESGDQFYLTSPLERLQGSCTWEVHSIDVEGLAKPDGHANKIVAIEILLENIFRYSYGPRRLMISEIRFLSRSAKVNRLQEGSAGNLKGDFHAVVIRLPVEAIPKSEWVMRWMTLEFQATAKVRFKYGVTLVWADKPTVIGCIGPPFLSHGERYVDFYRLDVELHNLNLEELTFLSGFIQTPSLAILKVGFEAGGFTDFLLERLRVVYHLPLPTVPVMLTDELVRQMLVLLAGTVFLLPLGALVLVYKASLFERHRRVTMVFLLSVGIASRVALMAFTGHGSDMEVWSYCARSYYEGGVFDVQSVPLPVTYYIILLGYAPYSALRWFGFQDARFLDHVPGVIESVFIKFPLILCDLVAMLLLARILRKLGDRKALAHASLYWLNPLTVLLSGVWGMYDTVAVTFLLCGLTSLFLDQKWGTSCAFFILSSLTKGIGIVGFTPLLVVLGRDRKRIELAKAVIYGAVVAILLFLPVVVTGGFRAVLDFAGEVLRNRAGMGSQASATGDSYMSFLDLIGLRPQSSHLNLALFVIFLCLAGWLAYKLKDSETMREDIEVTFRFISLAMIAVYFLFFRIYPQYYLWILPVLVLYALASSKAAPATAGFILGGSVAGIVVPLGLLLVGRTYYFTPVNTPADSAIMAVLPTFVVIATLLSVVDLSRIKTDWMSLAEFILLVSLGGWLSVEFTNYAYYGVFPLGHPTWAAAMLAVYLLARSSRVRERLSSLLNRRSIRSE